MKREKVKGKVKSDKGERNRYIALGMAVLMLLAVFTAARTIGGHTRAMMRRGK
jgi:hypothetical protein